MKYVVGIGEALWDMLPAGRQIGGAPVNFAYHASQFGHCSYAVSAVGKDDLGNELLTILAEKVVNTVVPQIDFPTGTVEVTLTDGGIPHYHIREGVAWDNIPSSPELMALARNTVAVCFGTLAQRSLVSRETIYRFLEAMPQDEQVLKIFDVNLRQHYYDCAMVEASLAYCNVLKINDEELPVIADMMGVDGGDDEAQCRCLMRDFQLRIVILTQGSQGSYVFAEDETSFVATPQVEVADTIGAGDSFTGSFIGSLLHGKSLHEAHVTAVRVAAHVCTQHGAMPAIPDVLKH